jgi:hypothetical protein
MPCILADPGHIRVDWPAASAELAEAGRGLGEAQHGGQADGLRWHRRGSIAWDNGLALRRLRVSGKGPRELGRTWAASHSEPTDAPSRFMATQ